MEEPVNTVSILIGIQLGARDLVGLFGERHGCYRDDVGMLMPRL